MPEPTERSNAIARSGRSTPAFLISGLWLLVVAMFVPLARPDARALVAIVGSAVAVVSFIIVDQFERARWRDPIGILTRRAQAAGARRKLAPFDPASSELADLSGQIERLADLVQLRPATRESFVTQAPPSTAVSPTSPFSQALTRSGLFEAPALDPANRYDPSLSAEYSTIDLVNRLEPVSFRWIESSLAEQAFLGWTLEELKQKSFLDIVDPDDRARAQETFSQALERGEALGLIVRIKNAHGKNRAVEVNVGARYGTRRSVSHLRCHLTDVTEKIRAERQVRLRSLELTQVNEQLRRINRELEDLKNRYSDLYEAAPAMYFSVDCDAQVVECNQTMVATLNKPRDQIVGHPYVNLLPEADWSAFQARFRTFLENGSAQNEGLWLKSNGEQIQVWLVGTVVRDAKGAISHARCVAQDVTALRRLEAELEEKNLSLARANVELKERNSQLDEFVHVVSHDLQEPLRTLIAFSDLLLKDYGDRIEADGQEYVRYLVDASRRMRAMILGLLNLSRAGKVIGEFSLVDMNELVAVVQTDLRELFRSRGGQLRINRQLPPIWGDRDRIGQLLVNLIGNGIKYNRSIPPWVEVGAAHAPDGGLPEGEDSDGSDYAAIYVKDNGIGIEPQFHGKIFQLFRRLHTHEEFEGTGVGLAICAKIVQAHGGRIWLESEPGKGTTFFVRFQCRPARSPAAPPR